jgi:hypothetical protein
VADPVGGHGGFLRCRCRTVITCKMGDAIKACKIKSVWFPWVVRIDYVANLLPDLGCFQNGAEKVSDIC